MKTMYRFNMRTLTSPDEFYSVEMGPFTPEEAEAFSHAERDSKEMVTGRLWVCDVSPITVADDYLPETTFYVMRWALVGLLAFVVAIAALFIISHRADEVCRKRWEDQTAPSLCRGEPRATNLIGEIECECR